VGGKKAARGNEGDIMSCFTQLELLALSCLLIPGRSGCKYRAKYQMNIPLKPEAVMFTPELTTQESEHFRRSGWFRPFPLEKIATLKPVVKAGYVSRLIKGLHLKHVCHSSATEACFTCSIVRW
jgi:hypothetical protein